MPTHFSPPLFHLDLYVFFPPQHSEFSRWVVGRMLRVAAAPDCDVIHPPVSDVLCSLLHTLRVRAPVLFGRVADELLALCQDLCDVLQDGARWPVTLRRFRVPDDDDLVAAHLAPCPPLVLPSQAALESLVVVAMGVVTDALRGVVSQRALAVAWETACFVLAHGGCGGARLRPVAMVMLQRLVELGGFQERQGHELFGAYLRLLETLFHPDPAGGAEPRCYGGELLGLTRAAFQPVGGSSWRRAPTLEPVHLAQLLDCVCALAVAGLRLGSEVSQSLCVLFSFLLSVAPGYEGAALIRRQRVTDVCGKLVCTVGTESQAEVRSFRLPVCLAVLSLCFHRFGLLSWIPNVPLMLSSSQCAEGFLQIALEAEVAMVTLELDGDGEVAAKRPRLPFKPSASKNTTRSCAT